MLKLLLTVGSQMPFDRLTQAVAAWARERTTSLEIIAQVGCTELQPQATWPLNCVVTMPPLAYRRACEESHLMIAHAGMGSILTAMELGRPLVVMPRRGHLRETRNDHQVHTAMALMNAQSLPERLASAAPAPPVGVWVALDEQALPGILSRACSEVLAARAQPSQSSHHTMASSQHLPARLQLIDSVQRIIRLRVGSPGD